MNSKSFMIVGGGFGQVPAVQAAKELGLKTIVVDRNKEAVGMKLADVALPIDLVDIDNVVAAAKKYEVSGVMTMQSDIGVPTVGEVVDALKLNGNGRNIADRCSNKILTRQSLSIQGVPQPLFEVVETVEEAKKAARNIGYPCIIKAPDSSGSRGVVKVTMDKEVNDAFSEAMENTRGKQILVEEFISGIEIGAQGFSINGNCVSALVHDDVMSDPPYMVPIAHAFPSSLNEKQLAESEDAVKACVDALGIYEGPSNIDIIIDSYGKPRIIEVGARIGATCLPELVFYYTGIDWVRSAIQVAAGMPTELKANRSQPCAAYILQAPEDGIMDGYTIPNSLSNNPNILEWEITVKPGEEVHRLRKGTDRIGKVVTKGSSQKDALNLADKVRNDIQIHVKNS